MNIEELSKSQLILLTILVNFVTSVATGILTVSLLDQAPPFVTQTVNRVVEQTVRTITQTAPAAVVSAPAPAPSNQDLVTAAIGADATRIVAIYDAKSGTSTPAIAVGTYLPSARAIVTTAQSTLPGNVFIEFQDNSYIAASLSHKGDGIAIYGFANTAKLPNADATNLVAESDLKLGETVLAISADGSASTGIVARIGKNDVHTTLPDVGTGSAAVDLSGNLVGVAVGTTPGLFIPANIITALLTSTSTSPASTSTALK